MPYITIPELRTHVYDELVEVITRSDETIVQTAITVAIDQAKTYLGRYDLLKLFGNADTAPVVTDENLKSKVKDLAVWHLIRLANPNIDLKMARTNFEDAVQYLKDVMKAQPGPGWPLKTDDASTNYPEGSNITAVYNQKRNNGW